MPGPGTQPATQACAPPGMELWPLSLPDVAQPSYTSQGCILILLRSLSVVSWGSLNFFKKRFYLFISRERGREREREEEKHQCVVASHVPPTRHLAWNPGVCRDWELSWQPFGLQAGTQSTEPHQPGLSELLWNNYLGEFILFQKGFRSPFYGVTFWSFISFPWCCHACLILHELCSYLCIIWVHFQ